MQAAISTLLRRGENNLFCYFFLSLTIQISIRVRENCFQKKAQAWDPTPNHCVGNLYLGPPIGYVTCNQNMVYQTFAGLVLVIMGPFELDQMHGFIKENQVFFFLHA